MKKLIVPGLVGLAAFLGFGSASLVTSLAANAATANSSETAQTSDTASPPDVYQGGHIGANGTKEVELTGDTATKAKDAALAAVPGATVIRLETDAEGAAYEAHLKKADGSLVTVKFDSNFKVTSTETGMGGGGPGRGTDSDDTSSSTTTSST